MLLHSISPHAYEQLNHQAIYFLTHHNFTLVFVGDFRDNGSAAADL